MSVLGAIGIVARAEGGVLGDVPGRHHDRLAVIYVAQDALFLGVVQVVVYTGAVMMLFLFVLMLIGVDSSESLVETIRGQRVAGRRGRARLRHAADRRHRQPQPPLSADPGQPDGNVQGWPR